MASPVHDRAPATTDRRARSIDIVRATGATVVLLASMVLLGWAVDSTPLTRLIPGLPPTTVSTAAGVMALGVGLLLGSSASLRLRRGASAIGVFVAVLGVVGTVVYLVDGHGLGEAVSTGLDTVPGRPSPHTAVAMFAAGAALATSGSRHSRLHTGLTLVTAGVTVAAAVGYAYHIDLLRSVSNQNGMSILTAAAFGLISVGLVHLNPGRGLVNLLSGDDPGARVARILLPVALLAPIGVGMVRIEGERRGFIDSTVGVGFTTLTTIVFLVVVIGLTSLRLRQVSVMEQELFHRAPVGYASQGRDGLLESANDTLLAWLGHDRKDVVGTMRLTDLVVEPDRSAVAAIDSMAAQGGTAELETELLRCDGSRLPALLSSRVVRDGSGAVVRTLTTMLDNTARVERMIAEAEADRLKSEFFALVSHELRTPLTSLIGYSEVMSDDDGLTDTGLRHLEVIKRNANRLDTLVEDLLLVAQVEAGTFTVASGEVDIGVIAEHCVEALGPLAHEAGVELAIESAEVPSFAGDPDRIGQVLDNLCSNAIKFTQTGGHVTIRIASDPKSCTIEVIDDGLGIDPDDLGRLFDRFYRSGDATSRQTKGVGLGLAITKAIVDQHGGHIEVESDLGRGSVFRVRLPRAGPFRIGPAGTRPGVRTRPG